MILALPGMGADRRIFPGPWKELDGIRFVEWSNYATAIGIRELARRIVDGEGIRDGDVLIGTSLGGIVAAEIASLRRISRLVLVASAVSKEEVSGLLTLVRPFASLAPIEFLQAISGRIPGELSRMFADAEPSFIRAMCGAIFEWDGTAGGHPGLVRIHGRHDLVIMHPARADLTLDGGHLIAMTHAEECVGFLESLEPSLFRR